MYGSGDYRYIERGLHVLTLSVSTEFPICSGPLNAVSPHHIGFGEIWRFSLNLKTNEVTGPSPRCESGGDWLLSPFSCYLKRDNNARGDKCPQRYRPENIKAKTYLFEMILRNTIRHQPIEWRVTDISHYCGGGGDDKKQNNTQVVVVTRQATTSGWWQREPHHATEKSARKVKKSWKNHACHHDRFKKPEHDANSKWGIHQKKMADNHVEKTTG